MHFLSAADQAEASPVTSMRSLALAGAEHAQPSVLTMGVVLEPRLPSLAWLRSHEGELLGEVHLCPATGCTAARPARFATRGGRGALQHGQTPVDIAHGGRHVAAFFPRRHPFLRSAAWRMARMTRRLSWHMAMTDS